MSKFYIYTINQLSVSAGSNAIESFTVDSDADFLVDYINCYPISQDIRITLQITSTSFNITNLSIPTILLSGKDNLFKIENLIFNKRDTIQVSVQNNTGSTINFDIIFIGKKLFT